MSVLLVQIDFYQMLIIIIFVHLLQTSIQKKIITSQIVLKLLVAVQMILKYVFTKSFTRSFRWSEIITSNIIHEILEIG